MRKLILAAAFVTASTGAMADNVTALSPAQLRDAAADIDLTLHAAGLLAANQTYSVFIGIGAGRSAGTGTRNILVGSCTALPTPDTSGFVNIAGKLCFWRDTGEQVSCPTPEPGCLGD